MLRRFGHVERMGEERFRSIIYESKARGTSRIGIPRKGWTESVKVV